MLWLRQQHEFPEWYSVMEVYRATLPPFGHVFTKDTFTADEIELIQCPKLVLAHSP